MYVPMKRWPSLILFMLVPALFSASLFAQDQDPSGVVARISYLNGGVSLQASGTDEWSQAPINYPMVGGDRIYTGPGSRAVVQLGGAELRVWQLSDVTLTNIDDDYEQIGLASGNLRLRVFHMEPGSQIEVDTPNGAVLVNSPGDYRIEAFPQNGSSIVTVNSGNAQITGPNVNLPLSGGYSVGLYGSNPIELQYLSVPQYDDLDYWSIDLDQRIQNSVSARYVSRQMVGYADLDANGTWQAESEFGPVWYPNNVPNGWRPYSTGHWAYVQPWGYTWVDDAPWGFAPFHYGRWSQINGRWGWFPGPPAIRPVYSPALVAFVGGGPGLSIDIHIGGGGGGVAAWFPIGVGEPYVPWYPCSPRYSLQINVSNVNLAVIRNPEVVNRYNTYVSNTRVTNTTINNTVVNNTVINNRTVNNTTVNNFNYANRTAVTAVPANALTTGAAVAKQEVRLTPQQQQQIAHAPIAAQVPAPKPAVAHPSLVPAAANVARPAAARPTLMTPTGPTKAVASPTRPKPVALAALPAPKVMPKNAAPPPAPPRPANAPRPASAPVATAPKNAPVTRPQPEQKPVEAAPKPEIKPAAPEAKPAPAPARPTPQETKPAPVVRPATPQVKPAPPAPEKAAPAPITRQPAPPVKTTPTAHPATEENVQAPKPAPAKPAPQTRPTPVIPAQTKPVPPVVAKPPVKPGTKPAPKDDKKKEDKEAPKPDRPN